MESHHGETFGRHIRFLILTNYLTVNQYDVKMFQELMKKPNRNYSQFSAKWVEG